MMRLFLLLIKFQVTLNYEFFYSLLGLGITLIIWVLLIKRLRLFLLIKHTLFTTGIYFLYQFIVIAFAFYFVVWHSLPSLKEQLIYLYGNLNFNSILKYLKSSIIY